jgi:tetratricopeptide (TPR) repeat protein
MNHTEVLRAELERLFNLDELTALCRNALGFSPEDVGGQATLGSFAGALVSYCGREDATLALLESLRSSGRDIHPTLASWALGEPDKDALLSPGTNLAGYQISRKLGEGRLGATYLARGSSGDVRLKVLSPEATRERAGLHRYLAITRLLGQLGNESLPKLERAGRFDERYAVAHSYQEGQTLSARVSRTGAMHLNEARAILREIASTLVAMHSRSFVHGSLSLDNVLTFRHPSGEPGVLLLDAGVHYLRARQGQARSGLNSTGTSPKTASPEQIRGADPSPLSDAYSLGALMYELLTGKPLFEGDTLDFAFGHLKKTPAPPSSVAPRGWVSPELDKLVLSLLAKAPEERLTVALLLEQLENFVFSRRSDEIAASDVDALEKKLLGEPTNIEAASALEAAVGRGANPEQIAAALELAASMIDDEELVEHQKRLLLRAARLFESRRETLGKAESVYQELLGKDPKDPVVLAGLDEVLRRQNKFESLVESWLGRAEAAEGATERARAMAEIGRIYMRDLSDLDQASVALTQAFCDSPSEEYAVDLERAAGTTEARWTEALTAIGEASQDAELPAESRVLLMSRAGAWYRSKLSRPDLAVPYFQAVLALEPAHEGALSGLTDIYRRAQQWQELGMILNHRANAAPTPGTARDLRSEMAELLEQKLGDLPGARAIYEQVLAEDATHAKANEGLTRILDKAGDFSALVLHLERRMSAESPTDKVKSLCKMGDLYDSRLSNSDAALEHYKKALSFDPQSLDALRGIETILTKTNKYRELVENLEQQLGVSATGRQKVQLLERMAAIYEEEFLDPKSAAEALEKVRALDPARTSALAALSRHYRVLGRWEDVSAMLERQVGMTENNEEKAQLAASWGRLLAEQLSAPERAISAYEIALEANPTHAGALEAVAKLREQTGDATRAVEAILSLADKADSATARSEHFLRAARLVESRGNRDQAIEYYRTALELHPEERSIASALRAAYVARGDIRAALELLEQEMDATDTDRGQARLAGEAARIIFEKLKDAPRAEAMAERALRSDASNFDAHYVLGELAFESKRYVEASLHLGKVADRISQVEPSLGVSLLEHYLDSLSQTGQTQEADAAVQALARLAPDNARALERAVQITFDHGEPERAKVLVNEYLERFGSSIGEVKRALATYRLGEVTRRLGEPAEAVTLFERALELDPSLELCLVGLSQAHESLGNWVEVINAKARQLDICADGDRVGLLLEIGEIAATKLGDRNYAAKSLVAALEEQPDDRRLLSRLMQLYSEEKDWQKLVEVVAKLAEFAEGPSQKVKYLNTAALVSVREVGDKAAAAKYFREVLELDPSNEKALKELIELEKSAKRYQAVEDLLLRQVESLTEKDDKRALVRAYDALGDLYQKNLGDTQKAASALEMAFGLDQENPARLERLSAIYLSAPDAFRDKGIDLHEYQLRKNPFRHESYKALRKIYTVSRNADASWALCQVLNVLKLAEPDEERFYRRMRSETAAPAQAAFDEASWNRVTHTSLDPLLTALFAIIEPAVVRARAQSVESLGLGEHLRIDPSQHDAAISQTLYYAAGVLGVELPAIYINPSDPGGLSFLLTPYPALALGRVALSAEIPPQVAAFVAAQKLAYCRPGLYLRHFIQTGTALKAWLFAAIKLSSPQFPVAPDIEGSIQEALSALRAHLTSDAKDHVASIVSKLIQTGTSLDLKKWVASADLSADRAGFVVCHDLENAVSVIRADVGSSLSSDERVKELVTFASSRAYFDTRRHLGVTVDS